MAKKRLLLVPRAIAIRPSLELGRKGSPGQVRS